MPRKSHRRRRRKMADKLQTPAGNYRRELKEEIWTHKTHQNLKKRIAL